MLVVSGDANIVVSSFVLASLAMDNFNDRDEDEAIFAILRQPLGAAEDKHSGAEDDSQFLNESSLGMEPDRRDAVQTSIECDDDSQIGGHPQSGEVY